MILTLPKYLRPKKKFNLKRFGSINDGGYVIPINSINEIKNIVGLGLYDDWSFEKSLSKKNSAKVEIYDHTVNFLFWCIYVTKTLVKIFIRKNKKENFTKLFQFFNYYLDFNETNFKHIKKKITSKFQQDTTIEASKTISLNEILKKKNKVLLKIDIEGDEYLILNDILKNQRKILCLNIEFHNIDLHQKLLKNFIKKLKLEIAHIHINNHGRIFKKQPTMIEMTFANHKFSKGNNLNKKFPINNLDSPNNKNLKDYKLYF